MKHPGLFGFGLKKDGESCRLLAQKENQVPRVIGMAGEKELEASGPSFCNGFIIEVDEECGLVDDAGGWFLPG